MSVLAETGTREFLETRLRRLYIRFLILTISISLRVPVNEYVDAGRVCVGRYPVTSDFLTEMRERARYTG